jgi:TfoX/Sxy family transcriptional regulator of competence genes
MAYNEELAQRVRKALSHIRLVEEKKMFGGIAFMVNGKMCITVGKDRMMFRVDPAIHDSALKRKGSRTMMMKGREYKGYIQVNESGVKNNEDFDYWIGLALDFNRKAKASLKRKR